MTRPVRWPGRVEAQLAARLRRRQRVVRHLVLESLRSLPRQDSQRADGWLGDRIRQLGRRLAEALGLAQPIAPASLEPTARAVDTIVTAEVSRVLHQPVPEMGLMDPARDVVRQWTEATAQRVREAEAATVERATEAAAVAMEAGADPVGAAEEALVSAEARAALAARDAVGTLVATVTQVRSRQLGSDRYTWRTRQDHRVRDAHRKLDGTVRRWSDPHPTEGHPGSAFSCRCVSEPLPPVVLPDVGLLR